MLEVKPFYRKVEFWQFAIPILLLVLWLIAFRQEMGFALTWVLRGFTFSSDPAIFPEERHSLLITALVVISMIAYFLLAMFVTSQFVLPVQTWADRSRVYNRLMLYFRGEHGPAAFVQEGKQIATSEELRSSRPGVIFVDLASAVVLERQTFILRAQDRRRSPLGIPMERLRRRARRLTISDYEPHARAAGPGIVFTRAGERIRGVVSLRRQFRIKIGNKAYTRDGFEVYAHIVTIFTLGEPADVIRVTYVGEPEMKNLQAINLGEKVVDRRRTRFVQSLNPDELDEADKKEIHRYASGSLPLPEPPLKPVRSVIAPYTFDEKRIFDAVFGGARMLKEDRVEDWSELPVKVAVEVFHSVISVKAYDELYRPEDPTAFPLVAEFRPQFSRAVRNQGVLSFQFIRRRDGKPITKDMIWNEEELEIFPVLPLTNSKILRDRGIKVIAASFPEIRPSNPLVLLQRFETWKARWQGVASIARAPYDRDVIMTFAEQRAQAQEDIIQMIYPKLVSSVASSEVVAHSVLQSLESFASDHHTRPLLASTTIDLFWSLRNWLPPELPEGGEADEGGDE